MAVYLRVSLVRPIVRQSSVTLLAQRILMAVGEAKSELSVALIGDVRMRRLNREYRKQDRATDVLAFSMREAPVPSGKRSATTMLGDIVISIPTAIRQARAAGRSMNHELATLLIHGVLHLCGYDHERSPREALRMSRREKAVFQMIAPVPRLLRSSPQQQRRVC